MPVFALECRAEATRRRIAQGPAGSDEPTTMTDWWRGTSAVLSTLQCGGTMRCLDSKQNVQRRKLQVGVETTALRECPTRNTSRGRLDKGRRASASV